MARLADIVAELDALLDIDSFEDYQPNGLQVEGCEEVARVATGVSASLELFERAIEGGAQLVLTHHGMFWSGDDQRVVGARRARLRALLAADVSLAAYHLPLDAHPDLGNNALIAAGLGLVEPVPFGLHRGRAIGIRALAPGEGIAIAELVACTAALTEREPLAFPGGPELVRSVGIVSGSAARDVEQAIAAGLDAFVTGEPAEWARAVARESGIHFVAAGHHATETFGVRALGARLVEQFGVEVTDIPVANPV